MDSLKPSLQTLLVSSPENPLQLMEVFVAQFSAASIKMFFAEIRMNMPDSTILRSIYTSRDFGEETP